MAQDLTELVSVLHGMEDRLTRLESWSAAFMAVGDSQGEVPADGIAVMRDAMDVEIVALRTAWREAWGLLHGRSGAAAAVAAEEAP